MVEALASVTATLNYLADDERKPRTHAYLPPPGTALIRPAQSRHEMRISDVRAGAAALSLDRHGFALARHRSRVADFYADQAVKQVYYPEVADLVARATGATKVVVFDHNVRCAPLADRGRNNAQKPVKFVHNDYTEKSAPERVRDLLDEAEAEMRLSHRFVFINAWRPIVGPVRDTPLAVCDAQSMAPEDFVPTDLIYPDRTGEVYSVRFNPEHRWCYISEMQPDEVWLLKCYDSATDGRARFTAHSAFRDRSSPPDARPRESIEARTLAFFAAEA